jgi:subtilisin family serine protease
MTKIVRSAVVLAVVLVSGLTSALFYIMAEPAGKEAPDTERSFARSLHAGSRASAGGPWEAGRGVADGQPSGWGAKVSPLDQFEPGEVLAARTPADFVATAGDLGFAVVETLSLRRLDERIHRIRLPAGVGVREGVATLRQRFPRAVIDANHHFSLAQGMDLPASFARASIGWEDIPADCGKGIRIGMIDAAIDGDHPALQGVDLHYRSFATPGRSPGTAEHGTAIAALLAGRSDAGRGWGGLLPGAHVAAASIFEVNERGTSIATARALLQAVEWMAGQGVDVVNISMAGPDNGIVRLATERALQQGLVLVAAAGNGASSNERAYPAAYQDVIAVTAVSADGKVYAHANRGPYIDFAAPGVRLWTAVPNGGRFQSGTSFAAPYVTAMAGLTLAGSADRTADAVRSRLRQDVLDLGTPGRDDVFGWGLVRMQPVCPGATRRAFLNH